MKYAVAAYVAAIAAMCALSLFNLWRPLLAVLDR